MSKLLQFQRKVEAIKKDSTNPFFKSSYLSLNGLLDAIKPVLNELELVLVQPLTNVDGRPAIETIILENGNIILSSKITLPDITDPQKMGACITYYRRYSIQSMLCLQDTDDDAESVLRPVKDNYQESVYSITVKSCKTLKDLQETWATIPEEAKTKELVALKNDLKTKLK